MTMASIGRHIIAVVLLCFHGVGGQVISVSMQPVDSSQGSPATLTCSFTIADPAYTFWNLEWFKGNSPSDQSAVVIADFYGGITTPRLFNDYVDTSKYTVSRDNTASTFEILSVNFTKDEGDYYCRVSARPTGGVNVQSDVVAQLTVLNPPVFTSLTQTPQTPVTEGSDVILTCTVDAYPTTVNITWKKGETGDPFNPTNGITSTLTLSNIKRGDSGYYTCTANNGVPSDNPTDVVSSPITVIVHSIDVKFHKGEGTVFITGLKENECIQLKVQYQGDATWQECGECITSDQTVTLTEWCAGLSQKRRRWAVGNIEAVRAKRCIGDLCSPATRELEDLDKTVQPTEFDGLDVGFIVGATIVSLILLITVIAALIGYLVRTFIKLQQARGSGQRHMLRELDARGCSHTIVM